MALLEQPPQNQPSPFSLRVDVGHKSIEPACAVRTSCPALRRVQLHPLHDDATFFYQVFSDQLAAGLVLHLSSLGISDHHHGCRPDFVPVSVPFPSGRQQPFSAAAPASFRILLHRDTLRLNVPGRCESAMRSMNYLSTPYPLNAKPTTGRGKHTSVIPLLEHMQPTKTKTTSAYSSCSPNLEFLPSTSHEKTNVSRPHLPQLRSKNTRQLLPLSSHPSLSVHRINRSIRPKKKSRQENIELAQRSSVIQSSHRFPPDPRTNKHSEPSAKHHLILTPSLPRPSSHTSCPHPPSSATCPSSNSSPRNRRCARCGASTAPAPGAPWPPRPRRSPSPSRPPHSR